MMINTKIGVMQLQQGTPMTAGEPTEARRVPADFRASMALLTPEFQASRLQNCRTTLLHCLSHLVCGILLWQH